MNIITFEFINKNLQTVNLRYWVSLIDFVLLSDFVGGFGLLVAVWVTLRVILCGYGLLCRLSWVVSRVFLGWYCVLFAVNLIWFNYGFSRLELVKKKKCELHAIQHFHNFSKFSLKKFIAFWKKNYLVLSSICLKMFQEFFWKIC